MAITQGETTSFRKELLQGVHDFDTDTFMMALYTSSATLGNDTTVYTTSGEVSETGTNYTAGGKALTMTGPAVEGAPDDTRTVFIDFEDPIWNDSTITARGALVYNASKGNKACLVIDFGRDVSSDGGPFQAKVPDPTAAAAMYRIEDPAA